MMLRRALWARGYRYRLHVRSLPGTPDIVFRSQKVVVFVDSEFWHGHDWVVRRERIGTNREFWIPKIESTMARDLWVTQTLIDSGWTVLRFWGREIQRNLDGCLSSVEVHLGPTGDIRYTARNS